MIFVGVLLKVLAILALIGVTVLCTAVAVLNNTVDIYIGMVVLWLVAGLGCLTVWTIGHAITEVKKLKKRVETLERRVQRSSGEDFAPEQSAQEFTGYVGRYDSSPRAKSGVGKWVLIVALVLVLLAVVGGIIWMFIGRSSAPAPAIPETAPMDYAIPVETAPSIEIPVMEPPAEEAAPAATAEALALGEAIVTDFVLLQLDSFVVESDIQHSVTVGNVTRTTGPDPLPGQQYVCLEGSIQNISTSPLPVYDFFLGRFDLDGYTYKVGATDCDILTTDGQPVSGIDPLMTYTVRIYTAIPDQLADNLASAEFTMGFFDGFENQELSSVRAFAEDPVSQCPYQYSITLR